jgi:hypothetical protein
MYTRRSAWSILFTYGHFETDPTEAVRLVRIPEGVWERMKRLGLFTWTASLHSSWLALVASRQLQAGGKRKAVWLFVSSTPPKFSKMISGPSTTTPPSKATNWSRAVT